MFKPREGYYLLETEFKRLKDDAKKILSTVKSKHPYLEIEKFNFIVEEIEKTNQELYNRVNAELESLPQSEIIKENILALLEGIVGDSYSQERINKIEKEGKKRYEYEIPPGFSDKHDKINQGYRTYGDISYNKMFGDLLVWYQMIDMSLDRSVPVIFITEEKKEDWWQLKGRTIIKPHPNLIQEFINKTGQLFYMYRTENFVKYAAQYLDTDVTDEEVNYVFKDVEQIRIAEEQENYSVDRSGYSTYNSHSKEHLLDTVSVNKIMEFLLDDEKVDFRNEWYEYLTNNNNAKYNTEAFRNIVKSGLFYIHDRVQNKAKGLLDDILDKDFDKARYYVDKINKLPESKIQKTALLLNYIDEMSDWLASQELPF